MRFNIATSILTVQASATAKHHREILKQKHKNGYYDNNNDDSSLSKRHANNNIMKRKASEILHLYISTNNENCDDDDSEMTESSSVVPTSSSSGSKSPLLYLNRLKNQKRQQRQQQLYRNRNNEVIECDPSTSTTVTTMADIGILSCGYGQYCIESTASTIGGICVDLIREEVDEQQQQQQQKHRTTSTMMTELSSSTLPSSCVSGITPDGGIQVCLDDFYCIEPCNTTCINSTFALEYLRLDDGTFETSSCTTIYAPPIFGTPNGANGVIDNENDNVGSITYCDFRNETYCSVSIHNQECYSCELTFPSEFNGTFSCLSFNCTNIILGTSADGSTVVTGNVGADCYGDRLILPDFDTIPGTYDCLYYNPCPICSDANGYNSTTNTTMIIESSSSLLMPNFIIERWNISCIDLQTFGIEGRISPTFCPLAQIYGYLDCGCNTSSTGITIDVPFICNVCNDGEMITNPNVMIDIPPLLFHNVSHVNDMNDIFNGIIESDEMIQLTCQEIYDFIPYASGIGLLTQSNCLQFQSIVSNSCGCPTDTLSPAVSPTPGSPTLSPISQQEEEQPSTSPSLSSSLRPTKEDENENESDTSSSSKSSILSSMMSTSTTTTVFLGVAAAVVVAISSLDWM